MPLSSISPSPICEEEKMMHFIRDVKTSLKQMNLAIVQKIYSVIDCDDLSINYEFVESCKGRPIVKIIKFNGNELVKPIYFFKSSGESRIGCNLENIWFPIGKFDNIQQCKNYNFNGDVIRIKKAEDDYFIASYDYLKQLIEKELYDTHESEGEGESNIEKIELVKYSRFINKKYALISKYLHNFYD